MHAPLRHGMRIIKLHTLYIVCICTCSLINTHINNNNQEKYIYNDNNGVP